MGMLGLAGGASPGLGWGCSGIIMGPEALGVQMLDFIDSLRLPALRGATGREEGANAEE